MKIAVDMTPYIAGGANGGIVPLIIATIRELVARTDDEITIITTSENFDSLSFMDQDRISRCSIDGKKKSVPIVIPVIHEIIIPSESESTANDTGLLIKQAPVLHSIWHRIKPIVRWITPCGIWELLHQFKVNIIIKREKEADEMRQEQSPFPVLEHEPEVVSPLEAITGQKFDLFYCPFTGIPIEDPSVPVVSVLHDIQHKYFPWFFSHDELQFRDRFYENLIRINPYIISVSKFTMRTFLDTYRFDPNRIIPILSSVQNRLDGFSSADDNTYLEKYVLQKEKYIFYPANFWPHKNHRGLFTAYCMLKHRRPELSFKLVLTGFSGDGNKEWLEAVEKMGLNEDVLFLGYVSDAELAALLRNCRFMVFPSLFEGFGMPVTEALHMGTTVLCSNVTSLPEVGGDCVFYFDPYDPADIEQKMEFVLDHPEAAEEKKRHIADHLSLFSLDAYIEKISALFKKIVNEKEM